MSQETAPDLDRHIVREFTSERGETFAVAFPKDAGYDENTLDSELASHSEKWQDDALAAEDSDWIEVNWPVGYNSVFRGIDPAVANIGISDLDVTTYSIIWKYNIQFTNTKGWGFQFKDETGDIYRISTIRNGFHYLLYNSSKPTIVGVK